MTERYDPGEWSLVSTMSSAGKLFWTSGKEVTPHLIASCSAAAGEVFGGGLGAPRFRAGKANHVSLPVKTGDKHGAAVIIAPRLMLGDLRPFAPLGRDISQPLAEASSAELRSAAKELDGVVDAVGRGSRFHGSEMRVAQG